ncbi:MAG: dihydroorotase [candidate division WOR-3 bacterium]|nr:MAG: dihydroorotase [candidate division WOR-3 bacterium]
MSSLLIKGARVVDPAAKLDAVRDVLIRDRRIARVEKSITDKKARIIKAKDHVVVPGLIDLHCHLRDPGRPDEETIETGSQAAIAGGFTSIYCMPNTDPVIDNEGIVNYIYKEAARVDLCNVFPIAAITKGREGKELTEFAELLRAGARAFSDDGDSVADNNVFRHALEYSKAFNVPIFEHPIDKALAQDGLMNEGLVSTRLGLRGSPAIAEEHSVARDLLLAKFTGARVHLCHISTKGAVELIRRAKKEGVRVTCETCPHYFYFNDEVIESFDANYKVNPPIRTEADRQAILEGLKDGTIDCIATDHAPHCQAEKEVEFANAPYGMIGFETAVSLVVMELIGKHKMTWLDVIKKMTVVPAGITGEKAGSINLGTTANVTIISPDTRWQVTEGSIRSRSKNTPHLGKELKGRVTHVVCRGKVKYSFDGK